MSHKDDELNELLKPLQETSPGDLQMQKWQMAVQRELRKNSKIVTATRAQWALQLVAAMVVGVILGLAIFKAIQPQQNDSATLLMAQHFSADDATYERSHANLD